ncbi:S-layer homology domain-containing protein [Flavonifractor sp. AGMB03687]|uniref:S-layer homology domain-containing protein n=1 Tax=Flavonifractor sp. AGMB03687 TaxID=2785133 RepID=UPI001AE082BE|nr:S-layer homology domain-containing protein [Flavonifractor sp. AGMB03687]
MKRYRCFLGVLLAAVLLVSAIPAAYATDTGALNGESGKWADFDETVYDAVSWISDVKNNKFDWPSSGTVLLKVSSSTYTLTGSSPNCIGITIPAGLKVDIYKYYKSAGMSEFGYELLGHLDTTDGKSITIGKDTGSNNNSGSSGSVNGVKEEWSEVKNVYVPGTPSANYSNSYTDVPTTMWCYHPVMTLTEGGLLAGYGNGKFGPNDTLTKEQVHIIYTRMLGQTPYPNGNQEVASRAYAAIWFTGRALTNNGTFVLTAYETQLAKDCGNLLSRVASNGVTSIGSMQRGVYDCWRANLAAGKNINYINSIDELPDAAEIRKWIDTNWMEMKTVLLMTGSYTKDEVAAMCEKSICWAYNLGLVGGVDSKGTFAPNAPLTRGQLSQILYNMGWTYDGVLSYNK